MTVLAFLLLIAVAFVLVKFYGLMAAVHPGLWFAVAWIAAFLAYWAIDAVGGVPVYYPDVLNQLMALISLTAASFIFLTVTFRKKTVVLGLKYKGYGFFLESAGPYRYFSIIGLLGAVINWVALGANFGYEDSIRQQWLSEIPTVTAYMWYLYFLSYPAAIMGGRILFSDILRGDSIFKFRTLYWFVPGVAGFFWSMGTGGRQALGILLFHFVVGAAFTLSWAAENGFKIPTKRLIKLISTILLIVVFFSLFVGLTGLSRAKQQGAEASSFDDVWYLAPIGQLISYTGLTLATHQAYGEPVARDLTETGPVSIAGLQYFGLRYITGWRYLTVDDTNPERALAASGQELASGTRNVFYDFQADFGFFGAAVVCVVFVLISHFLFLKTRFLAGRRLVAATPLAMMIMFWGYSHQFSLLMFNTFYWLFVSCVLWDISLRFIKKR